MEVTTEEEEDSASASASAAAGGGDAVAAAGGGGGGGKDGDGWICDLTFKPYTGVRGEYGGVSRDDLDAMLVRAEHIVHTERERRRSEAMTKRSSALLVGKGISYMDRKWQKGGGKARGIGGGRKRRNYAADEAMMG